MGPNTTTNKHAIKLAKEKKMIIEQTIDKLYQMKLFGMANSVKERVSRPDHRDLSVSVSFGSYRGR